MTEKVEKPLKILVTCTLFTSCCVRYIDADRISKAATMWVNCISLLYYQYTLSIYILLSTEVWWHYKSCSLQHYHWPNWAHRPQHEAPGCGEEVAGQSAVLHEGVSSFWKETCRSEGTGNSAWKRVLGPLEKLKPFSSGAYGFNSVLSIFFFFWQLEKKRQISVKICEVTRN